MGDKRPTKSARRRANERKRKAAAANFAAELGPVPDHIRQAAKDLCDNTSQDLRQEPFERAPAHMVDYDEYPTINKSALREISKAAADERSLSRAETKSELKRLYADIWGTRGSPKLISKMHEEAGQGKISERTIRQYMQEDRDKRQTPRVPD